MTVSADQVKKLREKTGAGFMDCKQALQEVSGDFEKAIDVLRQKGIASAGKRKGRATLQGCVGSYIHAGSKIGVLVEVNCETDFVARTDEFQRLVRDLAMQVAAASPKFLTPDEIPEKELEKEKEIYRVQAKESGKPEKVIEKIIEGRMSKYHSEVCLLEMPFLRDDTQKVQQHVDGVSGKLGENIQVTRFARFELGETRE